MDPPQDLPAASIEDDAVASLLGNDLGHPSVTSTASSYTLFGLRPTAAARPSSAPPSLRRSPVKDARAALLLPASDIDDGLSLSLRWSPRPAKATPAPASEAAGLRVSSAKLNVPATLGVHERETVESLSARREAAASAGSPLKKKLAKTWTPGPPQPDMWSTGGSIGKAAGRSSASVPPTTHHSTLRQLPPFRQVALPDGVAAFIEDKGAPVPPGAADKAAVQRRIAAHQQLRELETLHIAFGSDITDVYGKGWAVPVGVATTAGVADAAAGLVRGPRSRSAGARPATSAPSGFGVGVLGTQVRYMEAALAADAGDARGRPWGAHAVAPSGTITLDRTHFGEAVRIPVARTAARFDPATFSWWCMDPAIGGKAGASKKAAAPAPAGAAPVGGDAADAYALPVHQVPESVSAPATRKQMEMLLLQWQQEQALGAAAAARLLAEQAEAAAAAASSAIAVRRKYTLDSADGEAYDDAGSDAASRSSAAASLAQPLPVFRDVLTLRDFYDARARHAGALVNEFRAREADTALKNTRDMVADWTVSAVGAGTSEAFAAFKSQGTASYAESVASSIDGGHAARAAAAAAAATPLHAIPPGLASLVCRPDLHVSLGSEAAETVLHTCAGAAYGPAVEAAVASVSPRRVVDAVPALQASAALSAIALDTHSRIEAALRALEHQLEPFSQHHADLVRDVRGAVSNCNRTFVGATLVAAAGTARANADAAVLAARVSTSLEAEEEARAAAVRHFNALRVELEAQTEELRAGIEKRAADAEARAAAAEASQRALNLLVEKLKVPEETARLNDLRERIQELEGALQRKQQEVDELLQYRTLHMAAEEANARLHAQLELAQRDVEAAKDTAKEQALLLKRLQQSRNDFLTAEATTAARLEGRATGAGAAGASGSAAAAAATTSLSLTPAKGAASSRGQLQPLGQSGTLLPTPAYATGGGGFCVRCNAALNAAASTLDSLKSMDGQQAEDVMRMLMAGHRPTAGATALVVGPGGAMVPAQSNPAAAGLGCPVYAALLPPLPAVPLDVIHQIEAIQANQAKYLAAQGRGRGGPLGAGPGGEAAGGASGSTPVQLHPARPQAWVRWCMRAIVLAKLRYDALGTVGARLDNLGAGARRLRFPEFVYGWFETGGPSTAEAVHAQATGLDRASERARAALEAVGNKALLHSQGETGSGSAGAEMAASTVLGSGAGSYLGAAGHKTVRRAVEQGLLPGLAGAPPHVPTLLTRKAPAATQATARSAGAGVGTPAPATPSSAPLRAQLRRGHSSRGSEDQSAGPPTPSKTATAASAAALPPPPPTIVGIDWGLSGADEARWAFLFGVRALAKDDPEARLFYGLLDERHGEDEESFYVYALSTALSVSGVVAGLGATGGPGEPDAGFTGGAPGGGTVMPTGALIPCYGPTPFSCDFGDVPPYLDSEEGVRRVRLRQAAAARRANAGGIESGGRTDSMGASGVSGGLEAPGTMYAAPSAPGEGVPSAAAAAAAAAAPAMPAIPSDRVWLPLSTALLVASRALARAPTEERAAMLQRLRQRSVPSAGRLFSISLPPPSPVPGFHGASAAAGGSPLKPGEEAPASPGGNNKHGGGDAMQQPPVVAHLASFAAGATPARRGAGGSMELGGDAEPAVELARKVDRLQRMYGPPQAGPEADGDAAEGGEGRGRRGGSPSPPSSPGAGGSPRPSSPLGFSASAQDASWLDPDVIPPGAGGSVSTTAGPLFDPRCIDLYLFLRLLLLEFREEQARRRATVKHMFEVAAGGEGGAVPMARFSAVVRSVLPTCPAGEVASLYREAAMVGGGRVTFDAFLAAAESRQLFTRCLRLPPPVLGAYVPLQALPPGGPPLRGATAASYYGERGVTQVQVGMLTHTVAARLACLTDDLEPWVSQLPPALHRMLSQAQEAVVAELTEAYAMQGAGRGGAHAGGDDDLGGGGSFPSAASVDFPRRSKPAPQVPDGRRSVVAYRSYLLVLLALRAAHRADRGEAGGPFAVDAVSKEFAALEAVLRDDPTSLAPDVRTLRAMQRAGTPLRLPNLLCRGPAGLRAPAAQAPAAPRSGRGTSTSSGSGGTTARSKGGRPAPLAPPPAVGTPSWYAALVAPFPLEPPPLPSPEGDAEPVPPEQVAARLGIDVYAWDPVVREHARRALATLERAARLACAIKLANVFRRFLPAFRARHGRSATGHEAADVDAAEGGAGGELEEGGVELPEPGEESLAQFD